MAEEANNGVAETAPGGAQFMVHKLYLKKDAAVSAVDSPLMTVTSPPSRLSPSTWRFRRPSGNQSD